MKKPKISKPSRRQVLAGGAALAGAGLLAGCGNDKGLKINDILGAEKLAGVEYTNAEREQLLETLDDHVDRLRSLRALKQPNNLAPATTFDPRLSGREYPDIHNEELQVSGFQDLPKSEEDIAFAPLAQLSMMISGGMISSQRLTGIYLGRIAKFATRLECFVTVTADLAMARAKAMDAEIAAGKPRGFLHGIPYALKDLVDTKDIKTTWGATPYKNRVAKNDAVIVKRLEQAGAVLLGKTTCGAIAYGDIWFGGKTRNPWNLDEGSSGSSGGSASATAAGLCGFSIGTETLGSIVSPSNRCGTAGLRPTFGRVPRTGAMALCWSLDKIGPICRKAEDTIYVLKALNGYHPSDPSSLEKGVSYSIAQKTSDLTIGYAPKWFVGENVNPVDLKAFQALKSLGVKLKEIQIPERPYGALITILMAEAAAAFEELTEDNLDDQMVWQDKDAWPNGWREARFIPAIDMVNADRLRRTVMEDMDKIFQDVDLIAGPNFAGNLLTITNFTGHPQLTLRAGFYETPTRGLSGDQTENTVKHRVPRNFSLWAPLFEEARLVRTGHFLERLLEASNERPSGF